MPSRTFVALVLLGLSLFVQPSFAIQTRDTVPEVAPGLRLTDGSRPYALDTTQDKPQLVPMQASTVQVNDRRNANVTGGMFGRSFQRAQFTTELAGPTARTVLHTDTPNFYVRMNGTEESTDDDAVGGWAIVRVAVHKGHRLLSTVTFMQLNGGAKRDDSQVETTITDLPNHWIEISPNDSLAPGEYALLPVRKQENSFSMIVYDFRIAAPPAEPVAAPSGN